MTVKRRDLAGHKAASKRLLVMPSFRPLKRGKLPKPFHRIGGARYSSSGLIGVSDSHSVVFICGDGEILTDTKFYGYLLCNLPNGSRFPLLEFHWHPSHKGLHIKVPCDTALDYTDRLLPGAPELALKSVHAFDPRVAGDRTRLIEVFCEAAGIKLGRPDDLWN
jgi:hypothetical protein